MVVLAVSSSVIPCKERPWTRATTGKGLTRSMTTGPELRTQPDLSGVCAEQMYGYIGSFHLDATPAVRGNSERRRESDGDRRPRSPTARPELRTWGKRGALQMCRLPNIGSLRFRHQHHPGLQRCEESVRITQACKGEGEWSTRSRSQTAGARAAMSSIRCMPPRACMSFQRGTYLALDSNQKVHALEVMATPSPQGGARPTADLERGELEG
ncbi:hypothetical protein B0H13DRAFT_2517999 [Mycena leptocephala]|nr:hypothetical protein B0H13DRAFT_2517999 [Mycena leptocephala]